MNVNKNINKLLLVLKQKGRIYKINAFQYYSEKKDKYSTKYQILKQKEIEAYNRETEKIEKTKRYKIDKECYSKIELLKYLIQEYKMIGSEEDAK